MTHGFPTLAFVWLLLLVTSMTLALRKAFFDRSRGKPLSPLLVVALGLSSASLLIPLAAVFWPAGLYIAAFGCAIVSLIQVARLRSAAPQGWKVALIVSAVFSSELVFIALYDALKHARHF